MKINETKRKLKVRQSSLLSITVAKNMTINFLSQQKKYLASIFTFVALCVYVVEI